jgi:benzoyl-CoA reductase/2-hydroxyglutaryl-CoA dehydratase subunit BcrC/BadD/HgdB
LTFESKHTPIECIEGGKAKMYYDELLRLCGYEPEEIERERPRIERAFEKLEFTPEDIDRGEERVRQHYDIKLTSIRKMLGLWIKGLIDLVLTKEEGKKTVYAVMPPMFQVLNAMSMVSEDIYVTAPDIALAHSVGGIFGKLGPLLETAEADLLPAGSDFCGGTQAKLGAIIKGAIPLPDLLVSSGFVCDQVPKVDELIGAKYGIPVVYADCAHDETEKNYPRVTNRRVEYLGHESRDALKTFEEVTGYRITKEVVQRADARAVNIRERCHRVFDLLKNADPPPTGFNNVGTLIRLANLVVNTTTFSGDVEGLIDLFYTELKDRLDKGEGPLPKGTPRVGISILCSHPDPLSMMEKAGLAVVIDLVGLATPEPEKRDPIKRDDTWERGAEAVLRFSNIKFARRLTDVCKEWDLDGAIIDYPIGCRDLSIATFKTQELITKEVGIPVLVLESDHVDIRNYSPEAMRTRVEAFAETLKRLPRHVNQGRS